MPAILLTVLLLYKLISSILLYLVPKKLRTYLPPSWSRQQENPKREPTIRPHIMDQDELKGVFRMLDRNGDGWITRDELRGSLEQMGIFVPADELAHMIDKIDMDEFEALYRSIVSGERESKGEEEMREAFDVFDLNGDGFITLDELRAVLAGMGLERGRAADDWKKMIMKVDADGDGMVDFSEFKRMMRGGAFAASGN